MNNTNEIDSFFNEILSSYYSLNALKVDKNLNKIYIEIIEDCNNIFEYEMSKYDESFILNNKSLFKKHQRIIKIQQELKEKMI